MLLKVLHIMEIMAPGVLIGMLWVYTRASTAVQELGVDKTLIESIKGDAGALVIMILVIGALTKVVLYLRDRSDRAMSERLSDMQRQIDKISQERDDYLKLLLAEREKRTRP